MDRPEPLVRKMAGSFVSAVRLCADITRQAIDLAESVADKVEQAGWTDDALSPAHQCDSRPSAESVRLFTDLVRAHRDAYLNYEIGLEVARHDAPLNVRDALLDGAEPVLAAPVLVLSEISRNLSSEELRGMVTATLRELGLRPTDRRREPRVQVTTACQQWARGQAKNRYQIWLATHRK